MAHPRQEAPAHLDGAAVGRGRLPEDTVVSQAFLQHPHIKDRVVSDQDPGGEQGLNLFPQLRKCRCVRDRSPVDPGEQRIESVKGLLRIDVGEAAFGDFSSFHHGNADGAHPAVVPVGRFHIENDKS